MPNYCSNSITITGPRKDIVELDNKFKGEYYDFITTSVEVPTDCPKDGVLGYVKDNLDEIINVEKYLNDDNELVTVLIYDIEVIEEEERTTAIIPYKAKGYSFNNFKQMPIEQINNWYNWRNENWNTKWDLIEVDATLDDIENCDDDIISVVYNFDTAWSPSLPITAEMGKAFPTLKFEHFYSEFGMCFAGKVVFENGVEIENIYAEEEEFREFVHKEFGEEYTGRCVHCNCLIADYDISYDDDTVYACPYCGDSFKKEDICEL